MTIYEILGIEEYLIDMPIPQDMILENIQYSSVSRNAETYFSVINSIILRASIQREDLELQVIEISLNKPCYIQEISLLIQSAIKYRILFVFSFDGRYLIARRNFRLTASTDHVYSENLSYTTGWIYQENLIADILCGYHSNDITDDIDEDDECFDYWETTDSKNRFYKVFSDILENIGQLNQCMIDCTVLSLRQFIDWYIGHSLKDRLEFLSIVEAVIHNNGMQFIEDKMFFEKNVIIYAIAELENSNYLRSVNYFSRHPFSYFDSISTLDVHDIENQIFHILYSEKNEEFTNNSPQKAFEKYINNSIKKYFDTVGSYPLLKRADEIQLLIAMQNGNKKARELLIKSNLKLVANIAKRYVNNGLPLDDLIQEGTLGLIKALDRHDISYDTRISTYATYWIKQTIQRAIMDQANLIRIPVHFLEDVEKIRKTEKTLELKLGYDPSEDKIADYAEIAVEKVQAIHAFTENFLDIRNGINENGESEIDFVIDTETPTLDEQLFQKNLKKDLELALATLTPREAQVLRLRFGLDDGRQRTIEEVGQMFNITRERIRQIEAKATRKLRHPSRSKVLRQYLDAEDRGLECIVTSSRDEDYGFLVSDSLSHAEAFECGTKIEQTPDFEYRFAMAKIKNQIAEWKREFWMCLYDQEPLILQKIQNLYIEYFLFNKKLNEYMLASAGKAVNVINLAETWTVEKTRLIEQKRQAEEAARIAEEKRQAEEAAQYIEEILISSEENDQTGELVRLTEEKRQAEEAARIAEEKCRAEEADRIAEEKRKAEEAARLAEEKRKTEEAARLAEEKHKAEEAARLAEERRKIELLMEQFPHAKYSIESNSTSFLRLPNIGLTLQQQLFVAGIRTVRELFQSTTEDVWDKLYAKDNSTHYFEIYSIEGARCGIRISELGSKRKNELKEYVDKKKGIIKPNQEDLTTLPNIGTVMAERLILVGIGTVSELRQFSTETIWDKLYANNRDIHYHEIYAIEGAHCGRKVEQLDSKRKNELKTYVDKRKCRVEADPEDLTTLPNIGKVMSDRLILVGINTVTELDCSRTEDVWDKLFQVNPTTDIAEIHLIECAKRRIKVGTLPESRKNELKQYVRTKKPIPVIDETTKLNFGVTSQIIQEKRKTEEEVRLAEEKRRAEEAARLAEEKRKAEEAARLAEAKRKAEEAARLAEEKRRAEEAARLAEEKRKAEEAARLAEEKRRAEEAARLVEEKRRAEEAARLAEEKRRAEETARLAEEKRRAEEAARIAEEKRKAEEAARLAEEKRKAEEAARIAEEKRKAEEATRIAEEKRRAEEAARIAEEKRKAEEAARIAEEKRKAEEAARIAEEAARLAEEKRRIEEAQRKWQAEQDRLAEKRRRAEEARKDGIYNRSYSIFNSSDDVIELSKAVEVLETIIDWKQTKQLILQISEKIEIIKIEKQRAEYRQNKVCQYCGGKFKGLFSKRCSICNKPKDY